MSYSTTADAAECLGLCREIPYDLNGRRIEERGSPYTLMALRIGFDSGATWRDWGLFRGFYGVGGGGGGVGETPGVV